MNERKWFYYKEQGYSNEACLKNRHQILSWFKLKRMMFPAVGNQVVRLAEANVDGKIKDTRNMLVDMISKAESHIYMEHLFIYDKYINDALMKRKAQVPGLKIRILADHNGNFAMGGLPNTLFLDQMLRHGVEIRARRTLGIEARFPNGKTQGYHQENHRKITSVDGKVIGGFEDECTAAWNDDKQVGPFYETERLQLQLSGKTLSPEVSKIINDLGATLLRAKDDIEKR